jgi:hypothetical protein
MTLLGPLSPHRLGDLFILLLLIEEFIQPV